MSRSKKFIVAAVVVALGATAVVAAKSGGHCSHGGEFGDGPRTAEFAKRHSERLQTELKLTTEQQPIWATYAATLGGPAAALPNADFKTMTAPEKLERRLALQQQQQTNASAQLQALKSLYAVLTPEQKKVIDSAGFGGRHWSSRSN